jgi:ElaB/YqjD/DUF883 family membrane-anchored ribosome-binding protein
MNPSTAHKKIDKIGKELNELKHDFNKHLNEMKEITKLEISEIKKTV